MSAVERLDDESLPDDGFEIIDGELVEKTTTAKHGQAQAKIVSKVDGPFGRRPGGSLPGGWIFATEALTYFAANQKYRPDVAGWRRERMPALLDEPIITVIPDWVCEVLSPRKEKNDTVKKMRAYHRAKVPHYWIVDTIVETVTIHRWSADGYVVVLIGERGEKIRAEPFDAVPLQVGVFFGDDEEE